MSDNEIMAQGIRSYLAGVDRNITEDDISTPIVSAPASPVAEPVTELLSPIVRASPNAEDVVESGPLPPVDETIAETLPANVVQSQTTSSGEELSAMAPKFGTSYRSNVSVDSHQAPQAVNEAVITSIQDEIAFILGKISLAIHDHKDVEALENGRALDRMTDLLSTTNKVSEALNKTTGTSQVVPKDFPIFQLSRWSRIRNPSREVFDTTNDFLNTFEQCIKAHGMLVAMNWERLMAQSLAPDQYSWFVDNIGNRQLPWKLARHKFIQEYEYADGQSIALIRYYSMRYQKGDDISMYADRYQKARKEAGVADDALAGQLFQRTLPEKVQRDIRVTLLSSGKQHATLTKVISEQSSCLCCNDLKKCRLIGTSITTTTAKSEKQWIPKSNKQCTGVQFINKIVHTILNNATLPTKSKNPILSITSRKTSSLVGIVGNHLHPSTNVQRSQNFPNMANSLQQMTNQTIWLFALYKKQHPIPWILTK